MSILHLVRKSGEILFRKTTLVYLIKFVVVQIGLLGGLILGQLVLGFVVGLLSPIAVNLLAKMMVFAFGILVAACWAVFAKSLVESAPMTMKDLLKTGTRLWWRFLLASVLFGLAFGLGSAMLVIPGVIVAVYLGFFEQILVYTDVGGLQSLKNSVSLVKGKFRKVLFYQGVPVVLYLFLLLAVGLISFGFKLSWEAYIRIIKLISLPIGIIWMIYRFLVYKYILTV